MDASLLETEISALEIIPYVMVRLSVVSLMVATSMSVEVDELCSTLGINGASGRSGDVAAGVSACDEAGPCLICHLRTFWNL